MLRRGLLGGLARMGANPTATLALAKRSQTNQATAAHVMPLSAHIRFAPTALSRPVKEAPPPVEMESGKRLHLKTSPRKLNLVAKQIRGLPVAQAITQMKFSPKRAAQHVEKVLHNTMHAAHHNQGLAMDNLFVARAWVGKGRYLKRVRRHARGRGAMANKYYAHLFVRLEAGEPPKKKKTTRMQRKAMKIANSRKPQTILNSL